MIDTDIRVAFIGLTSIFNNPDIDLILNLTVPSAHKKIILKTLESGKHSFSEKPLAENYSDVHHVWPIGDKGDDDYDNMLVLCPNHHAMFDLALIQFDESRKGHLVHVNGKEYGKLYFKKDHRIQSILCIKILSYSYLLG